MLCKPNDHFSESNQLSVYMYTVLLWHKRTGWLEEYHTQYVRDVCECLCARGRVVAFLTPPKAPRGCQQINENPEGINTYTNCANPRVCVQKKTPQNTPQVSSIQ